jgi:21S rRNA (uridine2791-2'-O)-methyltransferase
MSDTELPQEELSAFNAVSQDSAKILSEKLALSREVAVLKPELEHLRWLLAQQKDVLAEKLALERQLNTLEVELANERRAAQKTAQKQERENETEEHLRKQIQELEKELAKEKRLAEKNMKNRDLEAHEELQSLREQLAAAKKSLAAEKREAGQARDQASEEELEQLRAELAEARRALADEKKAQEKLRKENEQAQVDAEERQQAMGDKVDRLRSKLRDTQEELKKCRAELEKAQERTVKIPSVATTTVPLKSAGPKANAKKKRSADEMSVDDKVLLTPGNTDDRPKRPLKKRGFDLSMVGGKSEFSITPFLNKTVNFDGSPKPSEDNTTPSAPVQFRGVEEASGTTPAGPAPEEPATTTSSAAKPTATTKLVEKRPRGRPRTKPLSDSAPSKKNLTARNRKAPRIEPILEKVAEEPDEADSSTNQDQENRSLNSSIGSATKKTTATATITTASLVDVPEKAEPKKKKRKLLGTNTSTLFDGGDDEGERVKPVAATAVAAAGAKRPAVRVGLGGAGAAVVGKGMAGRFGAGVKNAFAGSTFSPLKRDRRGVAASFLA